MLAGGQDGTRYWNERGRRQAAAARPHGENGELRRSQSASSGSTIWQRIETPESGGLPVACDEMPKLRSMASATRIRWYSTFMCSGAFCVNRR